MNAFVSCAGEGSVTYFATELLQRATVNLWQSAMITLWPAAAMLRDNSSAIGALAPVISIVFVLLNLVELHLLRKVVQPYSNTIDISQNQLNKIAL